MAVKPYIAIVGSLAVGAACAAPLARLSQGLLQTASQLHVATGWGPGSGQLATPPRVWSPSWEWRTFAAFTVPLDGAATYHARLFLVVTAGDVRVRLGPNGTPLTVTATGVVEIEGEAVPIGGGLAAIELQIQSELVGATSTAAVVWSDTGYAQLPGDPGYAREFWNGQDRHVIPGQGFAAGGGWAVVPWPAKRRTDSDRTYTVQALSYASVGGIHVWGESDGIAIPTQAGDVRILRSQDYAHRQAAAALLGRTPYVQTIALGALSLDGRDQWGRVSDISAGVEVVPPMPVDAQEAYTLRIPMVHDQLADVDVEVRAYVDGVLIQTTTATIPPMTPDVGDGGSYLRWRLLFPDDAVADAWRESTADVPAIEGVVQVTTPGLLSVEIEAPATVVVLPPTLIPQRPIPAVSPLPTGTDVDGLVAYLTAPDEPWGTLRREIASWQDLAFAGSAAVSVYEASPVPVVRVRVDAVLTDCTLEVELFESDGVTSAGTITLDATGGTDVLLDGSIDVPGGEWYYVRVDTTDAGAGAVGGVRLYEEKLVDPTSLFYADRATLLAATPLVGSTGYVASYAAPSEVWQYTVSGWVLVHVTGWDGETAGQTWTDLQALPGMEGASARVGDTTYQYMVLPVHANVTDVAELGVWVPDFVASRSPVLFGYALGTEANTAALTARGLEEQLTGVATMTYSGTEIVGAYPTTATASVARLRVPTVDVPPAIWITALVRSNISTNSKFVLGHGDGTSICWIAAPGGAGADTLFPGAASNGVTGGATNRTYPAVADTLPQLADPPRRIEMYRLDAANAEYLVDSQVGGRGIGFASGSVAATLGIDKGNASGAYEVRMSSVYMVGYTL